MMNFNSIIEVKNKILHILLFLFFLTFNEGILPISALKFADEISLLIATLVICVVFSRNIFRMKLLNFHLIILLYLMCQIVNYSMSPFHLKLGCVLFQSLINIKVFIVSLSLVSIFVANKANSKLITRFLSVLVVLFVFGMFANFVFQESWNNMLTYKISFRYGILRPAGWFASTGHNSYFISLTFITVYLLYSKTIVLKTFKFARKLFIFMVIDFLLAYPLTVRKGMLMNLPLFCVIASKMKRIDKLIFIFFVIVFTLAFCFLIKDLQIFQDTITNFKDSLSNDSGNGYIRGMMIYSGFSLFVKFFPFGVGAATFGTVLSQYNTLEVYRYVGLPEFRFVGEALEGLYDSGLFSMLAENGFIGMSSMILLIYYYFKYNKARLDPYNYMIFKIITFFTILLSVTEPVWQNGLFTVFYATNLLFIYSKNGMCRVNRKWVSYPIDMTKE